MYYRFVHHATEINYGKIYRQLAGYIHLFARQWSVYPERWSLCASSILAWMPRTFRRSGYVIVFLASWDSRNLCVEYVWDLWNTRCNTLILKSGLSTVSIHLATSTDIQTPLYFYLQYGIVDAGTVNFDQMRSNRTSNSLARSPDPEECFSQYARRHLYAKITQSRTQYIRDGHHCQI